VGFMGVFEVQCVQVSGVSVAFAISAARVNFFFCLLMLHDPRNAHRTREMTADAAKIKSDIWSEAGTGITNAYSANGSRRRECVAADEPGWRTNGIAEPGQEQHSSERH
jgi:hypothetical protein